MKYKRFLLKISGESLLDKSYNSINYNVLYRYATEIKKVVKLGVRIAIVIGAGNFFRGNRNKILGIDRIRMDYMGMLGTVINSLALQSVLEYLNINVLLISSIRIDNITELYSIQKSCRYLNKGYVIIFTSGAGHPYFTTDTAAVLRGLEINADVILKSTNVSGLYDKDPNKFKEAKIIRKISYKKIMEMNLKIMDKTALVLGNENNMSIIILNIYKKNVLLNLVLGNEYIGSLITN